MRWAEISVSAKSESEDAAANILIESGCAGASTSAPADAKSASDVTVTGYLPVDDLLEGRLVSIKERIAQLPDFGLELGSDEVTVKWVEDDEWATAWKKYFKPLAVGRFVVKPTWEEYEEKPGDIVVELDPGMAFGTGGHPTTQLCMLTIQDYVKPGDRVLDMGTGSAILAIAAAKLGASDVTGIDIDSVAVEAAVENVNRLGLGGTIKVFRGDTPRMFDGDADVVIANIIARIIIEMSEDLASKVKPGGLLIASGIIIERADEVKIALRSQGLELIEEKHEGDWAALVMRKP